MRIRVGFVWLVLFLAVGAYAEDPTAPPQVPVATTEEPAPEPEYNMCPEDDCDGSGGGGGYLGCYDCTGGSGTGSAKCYTGGRYWRDCEGGTICWSMPGGGTTCQPYCGRTRCYSA